MKKLDVIGQIYGELTVISEHSKNRNGHIRYNCLCSCGKEKVTLLTHLRQGNTKDCGCKRKRGSTHPQWKGFGEISGNIWHNKVIRSAKGEKGRKELEIDIDVEYGWNLFLEQNKKCALSGQELYFSSVTDGVTNASLDRIDSSKGYVKGNVQWVEKDINMMKRTYNQEYFIKMCELVYKNKKV